MRQKCRAKSRKLKLKSLLVVTLLTFVFSLSTVSAQESINATGGDVSGSGGSVSYSVGQVTYQTHTGTNVSVAEGIQQPYEISVVAGLEETIGINLDVSVYPNPTADYLTLETKNVQLTTLNFQLYDINGKLLQTSKITNTKTSIAMSNLAPATYFVRINQGSKEIKTFKIIKN